MCALIWHIVCVCVVAVVFCSNGMKSIEKRPSARKFSRLLSHWCLTIAESNVYSLWCMCEYTVKCSVMRQMELKSVRVRAREQGGGGGCREMDVLFVMWPRKCLKLLRLFTDILKITIFASYFRVLFSYRSVFLPYRFCNFYFHCWVFSFSSFSYADFFVVSFLKRKIIQSIVYMLLYYIDKMGQSNKHQQTSMNLNTAAHERSQSHLNLAFLNPHKKKHRIKEK